MDTVLLYILGIAIALAGLVVSIGLHEIGHLIPAKLFGVKVGQYMIGFGPTLFSRRVGETEYGVKAIPLGGYISMAGMYPPARPGGRARTASTAFFDTVVQEADARRRPSVVAEAREASLEGLDPSHDRAFYRLAVWKRIVVMLGGPVMNLVLAVVFTAVVVSGFGLPQNTTTVGSVVACVIPVTSAQEECTADDPAAPAAEAGVLPGDRMVSVDGVPAESWEQATAVIRESPGETIPLVVERDGAELALEITPLLNENYALDADGEVVLDEAGEPVLVEVGYVGITSARVSVPQPLGEVLPVLGEQIAGMAEAIVNLPARLVDLAVSTFGGTERDPNGLIGVVGVGRLAGEITSLDAPVADRAATIVSLLGGLNIALFVFNLIPLLPLDGGHVAGALVEAVRRGIARLRGRPDPGPVDTARLIPVTLAITSVLGVIGLFLVFADLVNPVSLF